MSAKRFALSCSAVGALMTAGLGSAQSPKPADDRPRYAIAEDDFRVGPKTYADRPEPLPAPRPVVAPRQVVVPVVCYEMTAEFVGQISRVLDEPGSPARRAADGGSWVMTPREARLFDALVSSEKTTCDVLSRPQLTLSDGQTGFFRVGQQYAVADGLQRVSYVNTGIALRLTPRILPDGKVQMRVEPEVSTPSSEKVVVAGQTAVASIDIQTLQTTVELPIGHSALLGCQTTPGKDGKPRYVLWKLTPIDPTPAK